MNEGSVTRRTAMVTGASRGIGRATAIELARRGWNLVLTARSIDGGATFDGTSTTDELSGMSLSGSVRETAEACRAVDPDCRALAVAMDLTREESVHLATVAALDEFGRVDALVSNAIYQGPGINDRLADVPVELVRRVIEGDAVAPLVLLRGLLAPMLATGDGVFVHLTSGAASLAPRAPAGSGGWGVAYAMAKGAAHRIVGVLHAEHGGRGLRAYNLNPGHVTTEVMAERARRAGREVTGQAPDDTAWVIGWLLDGGDEQTSLAGGEVVTRDVVQRRRSS